MRECSLELKGIWYRSTSCVRHRNDCDVQFSSFECFCIDHPNRVISYRYVSTDWSGCSCQRRSLRCVVVLPVRGLNNFVDEVVSHLRDQKLRFNSSVAKEKCAWCYRCAFMKREIFCDVFVVALQSFTLMLIYSCYVMNLR